VQACAGEYKGAPQLSVSIREMRPAGFSVDEVIDDYDRYLRHLRGGYSGLSREELAPDRETVGAVYRLLRGRKGGACSPELLYIHAQGSISFAKIKICLDILEELELASPCGGAYRLIATQKKVELTNSKIYTEMNDSLAASV